MRNALETFIGDNVTCRARRRSRRIGNAILCSLKEPSRRGCGLFGSHSELLPLLRQSLHAAANRAHAMRHATISARRDAIRTCTRRIREKNALSRARCAKETRPQDARRGIPLKFATRHAPIMFAIQPAVHAFRIARKPGRCLVRERM